MRKDPKNNLRLIALLTPVLLALILFANERAEAQTIDKLSSQTLNADDAHGRDTALRPPTRRITPLRLTDTPGGSRVTIAADAPFDDYTAYRNGDLYQILIHRAVASSSSARIEGRGFSSAEVAQQGEDVLFSFRLQQGATVSLSRGFNRLELVFTVRAQASSTENAVAKSSNANGSTATANSDDDREALRQMRSQMEQLEARIKELEEKQAKQNAPQAAAVAATVENKTIDAATTTAQASTGDVQHDEMQTGTPRLQIQGFADVNFRASSEKGKTASFALGQLDLFITSRLSDRFSVLSELIIEANQRNEFSFEIHRLLLKYQLNDYFNFSAGRYHTSVGYYNTAYHHGSWFQTAADRPFIFSFEDKGGILPLHNVGLAATGRIPSLPFGLHYIAEIGNGRTSHSRLDRPVQTAVDENNGKAFNLGLFARPISIPGFQTGFSVYRDHLTPNGLPKIGQTITAGYVVYQNSSYEFLNELVLLRHALNGRVFQTPGFYSQVARRFGNAKPYFRYQYINVPSDDPIFRDVGRRNGPSLGLRYDLTDFAAFKAQYNRTQRRALSSLNDLILQLAFTF